MRSEGLQVEMTRERVKEGVEGAFISLHPEYSCYNLKIGVSGVNPETPGSPETPG
jgi:hypothetical protein